MKLQAKKRTITGKKVKSLRAAGILPANIYGPKRESENIQFDVKEFKKAFDKAGYSNFIEMSIEEGKPVRVLIKEVSIDPIKDTFIDASMYEIDEESKITVDVPIELTGESPAVKQKLGFLVQQLESVAVYCFPKDLPEKFIVDISPVETATDTISLSDLKLPEGVDFESSVDPTSSIVYIATAQKEEAAEEASTSEASAEGAVESEKEAGKE